MTTSIPKKTVLITGRSLGGIGSALALAFHKHNFTVFTTARSHSKISHLRDLGLTTFALDITDPVSIKMAVEVVKSASGGLDILVNNAGAGYSSPLDADLVNSKQMFEVNLFGRAAVTQAFAPLLISSKGRVINIGSIAAYYPSVWQGMYGASCAAVHQWSDVLRIELKPFGVTIILSKMVITGAITSNFLSNLPTTKIKPSSIYAPGKEKIEALMDGRSVKGNHTSAKKYAETVVLNIMRRNPKKRIWVGGVVGAIWFVSTFLWATAWDWILRKRNGIWDLKSRLKGKLR